MKFWWARCNLDHFDSNVMIYVNAFDLGPNGRRGRFHSIAADESPPCPPPPRCLRMAIDGMEEEEIHSPQVSVVSEHWLLESFRERERERERERKGETERESYNMNAKYKFCLAPNKPCSVALS
ncbi:hypothetical protein Mapa_011662 [Marchantia paleacea]|nr:hypothetical protein Mapa_011662 [Marchantia paleacea]